MTSKLILAAAMSVALAGCGETFQNAWQPPGDEEHGADAMMEGPGLFSGSDGEFTVVSKDVWDAGEPRGDSSVSKQGD